MKINAMYYYTTEGTYVWRSRSDQPLGDPECIFQDLPDEVTANNIACALNEAYIAGREHGITDGSVAQHELEQKNRLLWQNP